MPTYTFRGRDMTEAVEQVRVMLGSDAVIIDTLRGTDHIGRFVEITATGELRNQATTNADPSPSPSERHTEPRGVPRRSRGVSRNAAQPPRMNTRGSGGAQPQRSSIDAPSRREFDQHHQPRGAQPNHRRSTNGNPMPPELALLSDQNPQSRTAVKGADRYVHPNSFSSEREPIIPQPAPQPNTLYQKQGYQGQGYQGQGYQGQGYQGQGYQGQGYQGQPPIQQRSNQVSQYRAQQQGGRPIPTPAPHSVSRRTPSGSYQALITPPVRRVVAEEPTISGYPNQSQATPSDYDPRGIDPWGLEQNSVPTPTPHHPTGSPLGQSVMAVQSLVSQNPGGDGEAIKFVTERLNEIVHYIQSGQSVTGMPAPVFEHLNQFQRQLQSTGIESQYAEDLIEQTKALIRLNQLDKQVILAHLGQVLAQNLNCINPLIPPPNTEKNVLAFIGPTGVGKTTTIAKIAAHAQLTHEMPVTLISTDTFRMAAVEQLSRYATILDCPALAAHTPEELWKHIDEAKTPLVLVDTTGRNPKTQGQLKALAELFGEGWSGRTVLTVAANTREQDLRPIVEGFSPLKYNMVAVTKLDETYALGTVYNVSKFTNCPISWTTNGQRVPEDIELANAEMLAVKIIMEAISHKV